MEPGQVCSHVAVQGSNLGITLRQRPAAVILGQALCKSLFIHAGLPIQLLLSVVRSLTNPEPDAMLAELNNIVAGSLIMSLQFIRFCMWRVTAVGTASAFTLYICFAQSLYVHLKLQVIGTTN